MSDEEKRNKGLMGLLRDLVDAVEEIEEEPRDFDDRPDNEIKDKSKSDSLKPYEQIYTKGEIDNILVVGGYADSNEKEFHGFSSTIGRGDKIVEALKSAMENDKPLAFLLKVAVVSQLLTDDEIDIITAMKIGLRIKKNEEN